VCADEFVEYDRNSSAGQYDRGNDLHAASSIHSCTHARFAATPDKSYDPAPPLPGRPAQEGQQAFAQKSEAVAQAAAKKALEEQEARDGSLAEIVSLSAVPLDVEGEGDEAAPEAAPTKEELMDVD
jgi:hypothetical protein